MARHFYKAYIAVHKGEPYNIQKHRHAALYVVPIAGETTYYFHIRGYPPNYRYERLTDYDVQLSRSLFKLIFIGTTSESFTDDELANFMMGSAVNNQDEEFNSQVWVADVLKRMGEAKHLYPELTDAAFDAMIEAILEMEE